MQRHTPRFRDQQIRLREYLRVARDEADQTAPRLLHKRPTAPRSAARLQAYLNIEKGRTA